MEVKTAQEMEEEKLKSDTTAFITGVRTPIIVSGRGISPEETT